MRSNLNHLKLLFLLLPGFLLATIDDMMKATTTQHVEKAYLYFCIVILKAVR